MGLKASEAREVHIRDLVHLRFDTSSPAGFEFEDEQSGDLFCYALRWENPRGLKRPVGPIRIVVIP